jgi:hypothetical protein
MSTNPPLFSRREMLKSASCGFGWLAFAGLAQRMAFAAESPLAAKATHFPARARRIIFLTMRGGPSHATTTKPSPLWMAGGGVKGGLSHGSTDEYGYETIEDKVHIHDLHATMMNLLGLDNQRLTYRYAGRDFRLTDVHGNVVREIIG